MKSEHKIRIEKRIMNLSLMGSVAFMVVEAIMAYVTRSHSLLMDCVFDITDLIMIGPFLVLVPLLYHPVTERHPYGYAQVESLFLVIKYSILLVVTVELIIDSAKLLAAGGSQVDAGVIAIFEFCVFIGCLFMYLMLQYFSKRYQSVTIKAELYVWKLDVIGSLGVALAFAVQMILERTAYYWIAPYIDPAVAIIMALVLIREPIETIIRGIKKLVLFAPKQEIMDQIRTIAEQEMEDSAYTMEFLDVIQTGRKTWVEIYINSPDDMISTKALCKIRDAIRNVLKSEFDQIYVEIIPELPDVK